VNVPLTGNVGSPPRPAAGSRRPDTSATPQTKSKPADDLTSIPGLLTKHRKVLAEHLQITTNEGLADADPEAISVAMFRFRPRPSPEEVREWQECARRKTEEVTDSPPTWERAATFVLSFEQRQVGGQLERQLVAEQAELEVEQPPASWPTWDCSEICDWLQQRLSDTKSPAQAEVPQPQQAGNGSAPYARPGQPPSPATARAGRSQIRIGVVAMVDAKGRAEILLDDRLTARTVECIAPGRLEVTVAGAETGREVRVALRFGRRGQPGWSPHEPAPTSTDGIAELEIPDVATGRYEARILAWTPDASAEPTVAQLGMLSVRLPITSTP
jgi:hypothetical protein